MAHRPGHADDHVGRAIKARVMRPQVRLGERANTLRRARDFESQRMAAKHQAHRQVAHVDVAPGHVELVHHLFEDDLALQFHAQKARP